MGGLFSSSDIKIPERQTVFTGQEVIEKAVAGLDDEDVAQKKTSRATARRGATAFRIPLASHTAGTKFTGSSVGLKI